MSIRNLFDDCGRWRQIGRIAGIVPFECDRDLTRRGCCARTGCEQGRIARKPAAGEGSASIGPAIIVTHGTDSTRGEPLAARVALYAVARRAPPPGGVWAKAAVPKSSKRTPGSAWAKLRTTEPSYAISCKSSKRFSGATHRAQTGKPCRQSPAGLRGRSRDRSPLPSST